MYMRRVWVGWRLLRSLAMFMADERRRGTLKENLRSIADARGLSLTRDMSHAELLEEKAERLRDRPFLYFKAQVISYRDMN
ncbi:MAG: hypothetical protein PHS26_02390, partial [Actinomycetota bacterium]|nr:hypothetical protein [Actinomycetota bacterium]